MASVVYYDFQTTGLHRHHAEVLQIGASSATGADFSQFVLPVGPIDPGATYVHGMTMWNGQLYRGDELLDSAVSLELALKRFRDYLSSFQPPHKRLLVAHNGNRFDHAFLTRDIQKFGLEEDFDQLVWGTADTLPVFRDALGRITKLRQSDLAWEYLGEDQSYDALEDAQQLQSLVNAIGVTSVTLQSYAYPLCSYW